MRIQGVRYLSWIIFILLMVQQVEGQHNLDRWQKTDVQHYDFTISLSDTSDIIYATSRINLILKGPDEFFIVDLAGKDEQGKGMTVNRLTVNGKETRFTHKNDSLLIYWDNIKSNASATLNIDYSGIPADGLIISKNKFGERTFFGDNWPDRAHNWLACIDHLSDKATVAFKVSAPEHYEVIANGDLVEEKASGNKYKLTHWQSKEELPTKVMVIGVADFAIDTVKNDLGIPNTTWAYPQNATEWFGPFRSDTEPVSFFEEIIGPYPFSKLANVQSTTVYGGMENAGNIFYREDMMNYRRNPEGTIVHEIAHQWFGNTVTEGNWYDLWLSEGFATYLTDLFWEYKYGREAFKSKMIRERDMVIRYARRNNAPVIDTTITNYRDLLTINVYEKAAWFLHMLRREMGDELFMKLIRTYYEKYKYSNALTGDFKNLAESLSGKHLNQFFKQWLRKPGFPVLNINWYQKKKNVFVKIEQQQKDVIFDFPLEIGLLSNDSTMKTESIHMNGASETFSFPVSGKIINLVPDPEVWLLFDGKATKKKF
jgi:aminopeptidase N